MAETSWQGSIVELAWANYRFSGEAMRRSPAKFRMRMPDFPGEVQVARRRNSSTGREALCFAAAKFAEVAAVRDQAGFASYAGSCYRPGCLREPTHAGTSTIARVRLHDAH